MSYRTLPGAAPGGDLSLRRRHPAIVRQHSGDRSLPEAVSSQSAGGCRTGAKLQHVNGSSRLQGKTQCIID